MLTWKYTYYTPSTLIEVQRKRIREQAVKDPSFPIEKEMKKVASIDQLFFPFHKYAIEVWARCIIPYLLIRFGLFPLLFLPLGTEAYFWVLLQSVLAEFLTNLHSFIVIAPNHSGSDLYRFHSKYKNKQEFYIRQIIGSANYHTGSEWINYLQGYLNYQIEHHLFPDVPMLKLKEYQPRVKLLCEKYNVPYIQESIWKRFYKMIQISIGQESMKQTNITTKASPE